MTAPDTNRLPEGSPESSLLSSAIRSAQASNLKAAAGHAPSQGARAEAKPRLVKLGEESDGEVSSLLSMHKAG